MPARDASGAFPIEPPIEPMLAKLATELPAGAGWLFEIRATLRISTPRSIPLTMS